MPLHRLLAKSALSRTLRGMRRVVRPRLFAAALVATGCGGGPGGDASDSEHQSAEQPALGPVSNFHVRLVEGPNGDHVLCDGRVRGLSGDASLYTVSLRITYPDASVTTRSTGINKASPTYVDNSDGEFQAELVESPPASGTYAVRAFLKRATAFDTGTHQCRAIIEEVSVTPPAVRLLYGEGQATSMPTAVPAPYLTATSHRQSGTNMSCQARLNHANPNADYTVQITTSTSLGPDSRSIVAASSSPLITDLTTNGGIVLIERGVAAWSSQVPSLNVRFDFPGPVGPSACAITVADTLAGTTVLSEITQMSQPVCGDGVVNGDEVCDTADPSTPCCGLDCKSVAPSGQVCDADPDGAGCVAAATCDGASMFPGSCAFGLEPIGTPCTDDGVFCTGPETCQFGGVCTSAGNPCPGPDGDVNCAESCDEDGNTCTAPDPDNSVCDDGLLCGGDVCQGGTCVPHTPDDQTVCQASFSLGTLSGDTGSGVVTDSWVDEEGDVLRITEDDSVNSIYLSATVELQSPPGNDFDLCVHCANCADPNVQCSTTGGVGQLDTLTVRKNDTLADDDFDIVIEVINFSSTTCAFWDLTVTGNTSVLNPTCP